MTQARKTGARETQFLGFVEGQPERKKPSSQEDPESEYRPSTPACCVVCSTEKHGANVVDLDSQSEPHKCGLKYQSRRWLLTQELVKARKGLFGKT